MNLDSRIAFAVVAVLSVVPLWIPEFLPLVDIPQHAAQVASLRELWSHNAFFNEAFEVNWFTPYLGGYLLLYLVSTILPIVAATKLVVSTAAVGFPVVTGFLLREIGADERLKWLAIPGSYSFALYWGFMVYVVAVPVALSLVWLTVRFERNPTGRGAFGMAAFSVALFFCHIVALGFGCLIALTYVAAKNFRNLPRLMKCALPYTAPIPLIAAWMSGSYGTEASVQDSPIVFGGFRARLITLFTQLSGLDGFAFAVSLLVVTAIVLLPYLFGYRLSKRTERWLPLIVGLMVYFVFPSYMQSTAFLYQRLAVFLIPLWLMVWDAPGRPRRALTAAVMMTVALWLSVNMNRFADFAEESRSFSAVLERAEPGRRLAGMLVCNGSESFSNPVYLHFAAWYQAVAGGISDNSFAMTHPSMVRYRDLEAPHVGDQLAWEPTAFEWARDGGSSYDYFIVCGGEDASAAIFKNRLGSVELVARAAPWSLYRNLERAAPLPKLEPANGG